MSNDTDQQTHRQVDTYLSRAQADAEIEAQGRFKKQNPTTVTGAASSYPRQPGNSPWAKGVDEVVGSEPPLDIDIEFVGDLGGASAPSVETAPPDWGGLSPSSDDPPQFIRRRSW